MFAWLSSCCGAEDEKLRPSTAERRIVILRDQPALVPAPSAEPQWSSERAYEKTLELEREQELYEPRGRRYSRDNASIRNWFSKPSSSSSSTRRLQISGPTNFRHLHSESFQYPPPAAAPAPRVRPRSFRPLELSIYAPNNRLTPILPHLDCEDDFITPPPRVYTGNSSRWDASSGTTIAAPERSYSVMSFHIPRKHVRQSSGDSDAPLTMAAPRIPPKSRARASTAPNTERIVTRIASAMIERERLQAEINSVVERQSIFFSSRPSTAIDPRDLEPMPSIPAIPAAAPSFAERLSVEDRPSTAPAHIKTQQNKAQELAQATFHSHPPLTPYSPSRYEDDEISDGFERPLAPPLPLVLRPPLRKKKSFSRVSSWLQQNNNNNNNNSNNTPAKEDSIDESTLVTTSPRPVKEADGFYQCVAPPEGLPRTSMETSSSVYTSDNITTTDDDEDETKTAPTTNWSPGSSPRVKQLQMTPPIAERVRYFDGRAAQDGVLRAPPRPPMGLGLGVNTLGVAAGPRPLSVGVAF